MFKAAKVHKDALESAEQRARLARAQLDMIQQRQVSLSFLFISLSTTEFSGSSINTYMILPDDGCFSCCSHIISTCMQCVIFTRLLRVLRSWSLPLLNTLPKISLKTFLILTTKTKNMHISNNYFLQFKINLFATSTPLWLG